MAKYIPPSRRPNLSYSQSQQPKSTPPKFDTYPKIGTEINISKYSSQPARNPYASTPQNSHFKKFTYETLQHLNNKIKQNIIYNQKIGGKSSYTYKPTDTTTNIPANSSIDTTTIPQNRNYKQFETETLNSRKILCKTLSLINPDIKQTKASTNKNDTTKKLLVDTASIKSQPQQTHLQIGTIPTKSQSQQTYLKIGTISTTSPIQQTSQPIDKKLPETLDKKSSGNNNIDNMGQNINISHQFDDKFNIKNATLTTKDYAFSRAFTHVINTPRPTPRSTL
eukprot:37693_1